MGIVTASSHSELNCVCFAVKDKADVLEQVEMLSTVRDELTEQVRGMAPEKECSGSTVEASSNSSQVTQKSYTMVH